MRGAIFGTIIAASAAMVGCATSTNDYSPPKVSKIENSKFVKKPFDGVWDGLVKELSSDFFVINNIDKNSRLINISFSSQRPSDFVDCGTTTRTFTNARGENKYVYKTADGSEFTAANKQGHVFNVRRATRLEGRSNIYVAPENDGTNVTVNTKYVVTVTMSGSTLDGRMVPTETFTFDPSTKQPYTTDQVTCVATGNIEERILRAAK